MEETIPSEQKKFSVEAANAAIPTEIYSKPPLNPPIPESWAPVLDRLVDTEVKTIDTNSSIEVKTTQPNKILNRVIEAAKHNEAIEKVYERRHEVKDKKSIPQAGPQKIGNLLQQRTASAAAVNSQPPIISANSTPYDKSFMTLLKDPFYSKYVKIGFATALVLLILTMVTAKLI